MNALLKVADRLDAFARSIGKAAGWLILPLIVVIMFDVITRKVDVTRLYFSEYTAEYGYSVSTILQDLEWHFHAVILLLSFGFGYLANAHVRVDIFRELLPRRKQGWLEFVGLLILAVPFLCLMIYYAWDLMALSWHQNEGSDSMTGIDYRYVIKAFMPAGFIVAMASVIATLFRLWGYLRGDEAAQAKALDGLEIFADDHEELTRAREEAERALKAKEGEPDGGAQGEGR
jgi:TRAP-type mannitol/chloroaromatic compound transport system permease small subunit